MHATATPTNEPNDRFHTTTDPHSTMNFCTTLFESCSFLTKLKASLLRNFYQSTATASSDSNELAFPNSTTHQA